MQLDLPILNAVIHDGERYRQIQYSWHSKEQIALPSRWWQDVSSEATFQDNNPRDPIQAFDLAARSQ